MENVAAMACQDRVLETQRVGRGRRRVMSVVGCPDAYSEVSWINRTASLPCVVASAKQCRSVVAPAQRVDATRVALAFRAKLLDTV